MREQLTDIVKHTAALFPWVLVEGTDTETKFASMSEDKTVIFQGVMKTPSPELKGESALSSLTLLNGLLGFTSYQTDKATFTVKRFKDDTRVEEFEFKDAKKAGATYRLMNPSMIKPEDRPPSIDSIPWELDFEPQKAKMTEFTQLSGLLSEVDRLFTPRTIDGDLHFLLGEEGSSNHRASMVFEEGVTANIKGDIKYSVPALQSAIKVAGADYRLHLTSRGVIMVSCETAYATYQYIIRATR